MTQVNLSKKQMQTQKTENSLKRQKTDSKDTENSLKRHRKQTCGWQGRRGWGDRN